MYQSYDCTNTLYVDYTNDVNPLITDVLILYIHTGSEKKREKKMLKHAFFCK